MSTTATIIALGAFVVMMVIGIGTSIRESAKMWSIVKKAGFVELPADDKTLDNALQALNPNWSAVNVHYRNQGPCREFVFKLNIRDPQHNDSDLASEIYAAVISPHLNVPHFKLYPRVQGYGKLGDLPNTLLNKATEKLPRIPLTASPEFEQRYYLHGADEAAVTALFSAEQQHTLGHPDTLLLSVEGKGDTLVYYSAHALDKNNSPKRSNEEKACQFVDTGRLLEKLLR